MCILICTWFIYIYVYVCVWQRDDNTSCVCVCMCVCVYVCVCVCVCVWSHQYRGISYDRKGDLKQAIENFSEVRMSDIYLSIYVHIHTCKRHDSFMWLTHAQAILLEGNNADFFHNRGFSNRKLGKYRAATEGHDAFMHESCRIYGWVVWHVWMSHVAYTDESRRIYGWVMSHVSMLDRYCAATKGGVVSMDESCRMHGWVMSHIRMSHVAYMDVARHMWSSWANCCHQSRSMSHAACMNESCRIYGWVMSHIWMSHVAIMSDSSRIYERLMSHIWMSHAAHINGSSFVYKWVMSHIWISRVAFMNDSSRIYEWVRSDIWMSHVAYINESSLMYGWVMSRVRELDRCDTTAKLNKWVMAHFNESCLWHE